MYSAIPVPQVNWEKQTMRWARLPAAHRCADRCDRVVLVRILRAFRRGRRVLRCDRSADSSGSVWRHPSGWAVRYLRRAVLVRRPGKAAGHSQGPARWRVWAALADGIPAGRGRVFCPDLRPACASSAGMHRICFRTDNGRPQGGCVTVREKDSGLAHIFAENSDKRAVSRMLVAEFVLFAVLLGLWIYRVPHALAAAKVLVIVLVAWYAVHEHISRRVFGGVTGTWRDSAFRCRN